MNPSSPSSWSPTLLVIAKEPRPGRVKTRLTPPFTPTQAASLAEAALADTLRAVADTPASRRVLYLDGTPGPWLPPGFDVVPQCAGGLDARLADAFAHCDGPALLIGMDTPQVTPELLTVDFADCDAHFGPAEDGGFWALGLAKPDPALLRGVPMSTSTTGAVQRGRLVTAGLRVRDLPRLRDVDTAADAHAVAALAPKGRFAARLARCAVGTGAGSLPGAGVDSLPGAGVDSLPGTGSGRPPGTGFDSPPGTEPGSPPNRGFHSPSGTEPISPPNRGFHSPSATGPTSRPATRPGSPPGTGFDSPSATERDSPPSARPSSRTAEGPHSPPTDEPSPRTTNGPHSPPTDEPSPRTTDGPHSPPTERPDDCPPTHRSGSRPRSRPGAEPNPRPAPPR